jgi:hypothetical protein
MKRSRTHFNIDIFCCFVPCLRGISVKFRRIGNRFNINTIFKTKRNLRGTLMATRPGTDVQQRQCVYIITYDCGRCCIVETSRLLEVSIKDHRHNLRRVLLQKSTLNQHAYEGL